MGLSSHVLAIERGSVDETFCLGGCKADGYRNGKSHWGWEGKEVMNRGRVMGPTVICRALE